MIAEIIIPEWLASIFAGGFVTASAWATVWTIRRLISLDKRMQHLEARLGTNPPFGS